jgi:hypothetical protein
MSQTNEFAKAISPDYVYFDLQNTNTHNNEAGLTPQLQFLESRDGAIVDNAGEYNMSVTRFSVDTGNLPVLVVEPDLKGAFDPHRTIHKVAVITKDINFETSSAGVYSTITEDTESAPTPGFNWGQSVASSEDGDVIVFGEPLQSATKITPPQIVGFENQQEVVPNTGGTLTATNRGQVHLCVRNAQGVYNNIVITDRFEEVGFDNPSNLISGSISSNWKVGISVAVSGNGNVILIGTGADCPYIFIYIRSDGHLGKIPKTPGDDNKSDLSVAINHDGSRFVIGFPQTKVGLNSTSPTDVVGAIEIYSYNILTHFYNRLLRIYGNARMEGEERSIGTAVAMNGVGNVTAYTRKKSTSIAGGTLLNGGSFIVMKSSLASTDYSGYSARVLPHNSKLGFGNSISMNNAGTLIAAGAPLEGTKGEVIVYPFSYTITNPETASVIGSAQPAITPDTHTGAIGFGTSVSLSYDGAYIHIGAPNHSSNLGVVQTFQYDAGTSAWVYRTQSLGTSGSKYGTSISSSHDGINYVVGAPATSTTQGFVRMSRVNIINYQQLENTLTNSSSVASVYWSADNTSLTPPSFTELNGQNTATFPYYHCHSYSNFIDVVNTAIKEAYVANFNRLWNSWFNVLSVANADFLRAEFINIVGRCFSTPPYLEWNATLDPTLYLNNLFSAMGNYYNPTRAFAASGANPNTQVSTTGVLPPLFLSLAFNASLYSLFAGFPATETIINNEKFFIINIPKQVPVLLDTTTIPLRSLPLMPDYPFLSPYHNISNGVFSLPFPTGSTASYSLQNYFIVLRQEISTIDAWCPISSIVFTSNQLPIIPSQFSSVNTTGNVVNSATIGNRFALVITDLMTNQQGYRPNIIYNPTAEYRRISLTGNMGIRNIDINVFWRSRTGQLLPFRLPSGGSATLKLLFEKKNRNPDRIKEIEPEVVDIMGGKMPKSRR